MTQFKTWLLHITMVGAAACTVTTTPPPAQPMQPPPAAPPAPAPAAAPMPPPPPRPPGGAVDNGQPRMHSALDALGRAQRLLGDASTRHGGHRVAALRLTEQAIGEVRAGIEYAKAHPTEVGRAEPPSQDLPVDEKVPGADRQPNMRNAVLELREAFHQLRDAKPDKGGHRVKAMELIKQAIEQTREGIKWADKH